MSSSKRRKVDAQDAPKSAVSAISALAARRRLAASPPEADASMDQGNFTTTQSNTFDTLNQLRNQVKSPVIVKKGSLRTRPQPDRLSSPAKRGIGASPDQIGTVTDPESHARKPIPYASFSLSKVNHRLKRVGICELRLDNDRFLVLGSFGIRVLAGELSISGAVLTPSEKLHWVHAPHCHGIPVIRTGENSRLELHIHPQGHHLRKLERLSPLFRRLWNEPADRAANSTYKVLCTSDDAPKKALIQQLTILPEWNKKLASLSDSMKGGPRSVLICGPKSSGKSTFSKLLCNRILTTTATRNGVVVLDVDPGQPEYGTPGTLSLVIVKAPNLGTSFTQTMLTSGDFEVVRSHTVASVTPASSPELYKECINDLFATYLRLFIGLPLIVNTAGWILGTGLDILTDMIGAINPSEVIYMSESGPLETVESLQAATRSSFSVLPSQQSEFTSRTGAHLRAMRTMMYFHQVSSAGNERMRASENWWKKPLCTLPPLSIRCGGPKRGMMGIVSYDYQSPPELLAETINGMVLAVVEVENRSAFRGAGGPISNNGVSFTPEGLPYISNPEDLALDPRHSHMIGLVLVRGIDTRTQTLQVITPLPPQRIKAAKDDGHDIVLVHGNFDTPTWAYTEELYDNQYQESSTDQSSGAMDDGMSEDDMVTGSEDDNQAPDSTQVPWVEALKANEKRPVGSRAWRVRRDLGRNSGE